MALPPFPEDALELPDSDLGALLLGWFIAAQADDLGIPADQIPEDFGDQVRQHVLTLEAENAKNAALEKALHKAANGNFEGAGRFLRELMQDGALSMAALDECATGKRRQSANAKKSRADALQLLIIDILEKAPSIKPADLLKELRKLEGQGVIDEITDDDIFFIEKGHGGKSALISGLKDRMSRARKKLVSR